MNFFSNVTRNARLSPVYFTGASLSLAIIASDMKKNGTATPYSALAAFLFLGNLPMMALNFYGYKRALTLMQKHGYQDRIFKLYTDTFCGRQQVRLAAEEAGFSLKQKLHFEKINVKWYQFDASPVGNIMLSACETAKLYCLSHTLFSILTKPPITPRKHTLRQT
jgi:hypothetical protein